MYKLGPTAMKLKDTYDQYNTMKDAADALGVSEMRIWVLCNKLGIDKWRAKSRDAKPTYHVCENCHEEFSVPRYVKRPARFCSKKCQGKFIGKTYGWGSDFQYGLNHHGETKPTFEDLHGSGPVQEAIDFIEHKKG